MDESPSEEAPTCRGRLCKKNKKRFVKYVESTTTHGLSHVFIGKSYIRRLFWLVIVLASAGGCLYNCVNRISFLASEPSSTTISNERISNITFPAITICNANAITKSFATERNLTDLLNAIFDIAALTDDTNNFNESECQRHVSLSGMDSNESLADIVIKGGQLPEDFITECHFLGQPCSSRDFLPVLTRLGYCYTFNSGYELSANGALQEREIKTTSGTGTRYGLQLFLNIQQYEYTLPLNLDAGVRIAVHPQDEPAEPDDSGIAAPPGTTAFIGIRQAEFEDTSSTRTCRDIDQNEDYNFLRNVFDYSTSACNIDCFYTQIADMCNCTDSDSFFQPSELPYSELPACTIDDICCEAVPYFVPTACDCPAACSYITYSTSVSYSAFPANVLADTLFDRFNGSAANLTQEEIQQVYRENFISVNIYFESLNVERLQTSNSYDAVALLSDIGGQLGLFLGASIISIMEFAVWILDETKDRTCGLSSKKLRKSVEKIRKRKKKTPAKDSVEIDAMAKGEKSWNDPNA